MSDIDSILGIDNILGSPMFHALLDDPEFMNSMPTLVNAPNSRNIFATLAEDPEYRRMMNSSFFAAMNDPVTRQSLLQQALTRLTSSSISNAESRNTTEDTTNNEDTVSSQCVNCSKGEGDCASLKQCVACKMVKYCSRDCQISHRPQHKKACKKRAAELHDEALFKDPPPEECPLCMLPLPVPFSAQATFESCCGKVICNGCIFAMDMIMPGRGGDLGLCPFCRENPPKSVEDDNERIKKLADNGNAEGCNELAILYFDGAYGLPQDLLKANELWRKGADLGCAEACLSLGVSYRNGRGVEVDKKKAKHYYELAAMKGNVQARFNIAAFEHNEGDGWRAKKHMIIAAKSGCKDALDVVKHGYMNSNVHTKDEYEMILRAHQQRRDEMKSDMRDKAFKFRHLRGFGLR